MQVYNGSLEEPYTDPGAPIHITTGAAGCRELLDGFKPAKPYWSAFRNTVSVLDDCRYWPHETYSNIS